MLFSFTKQLKKGLKKVGVIEYPSNVKYVGIQVRDVTKSIKITSRGVYVFRFSNSALTQRLGRVKISRVPANGSTVSFNTSVGWKEVADTAYTAVMQKELVRYVKKVEFNMHSFRSISDFSKSL